MPGVSGNTAYGGMDILPYGFCVRKFFALEVRTRRNCSIGGE